MASPKGQQKFTDKILKLRFFQGPKKKEEWRGGIDSADFL
jgi:hypothetical protein